MQQFVQLLHFGPGLGCPGNESKPQLAGSPVNTQSCFGLRSFVIFFCLTKRPLGDLLFRFSRVLKEILTMLAFTKGRQ